MGERLVILAGGVSSRMKRSAASSELDPKLQHAADNLPKSMITIGDAQRPFLDYLLYNARSAGYTDILIVIGPNDPLMRSYYGKHDRGNEFHGLSISYAVQHIPEGRSKPLGTADALLQGLLTVPEWSGKYFSVCNSDNLYSANALRAVTQVSTDSAMIDYNSAALGMSSGRFNQFAVTKKNAEGFLEALIEKPTEAEIEQCRSASGHVGVSMNLFRLSYDRILPALKDVPLHPLRQEKELPSAVLLMTRSSPERVRAIEIAEPVPDLTTKDDIGPVMDLIRSSFPKDLWQ
ncbi:MAG: sugar phosphate nucleotidyltransferase [Bacteroidota bacterium]